MKKIPSRSPMKNILHDVQSTLTNVNEHVTQNNGLARLVRYIAIYIAPLIFCDLFVYIWAKKYEAGSFIFGQKNARLVRYYLDQKKRGWFVIWTIKIRASSLFF